MFFSLMVSNLSLDFKMRCILYSLCTWGRGVLGSSQGGGSTYSLIYLTSALPSVWWMGFYVGSYVAAWSAVVSIVLIPKLEKYFTPSTLDTLKHIQIPIHHHYPYNVQCFVFLSIIFPLFVFSNRLVLKE